MVAFRSSIDSAMPIFDACVIGAGLIGSAAAKYCAEAGTKTCLIGPPEPNLQDYGSHDVFGAWFDEGRITRHLDRDPVWTYLAAESIKRYRSIEALSGVKFFTENGFLTLGDNNDDKRLDDVIATAKRLGVRFERLEKEELERRFPYLRIPDGMVGLYEEKRSGTINPRRLVEAQLKLLEKHGGSWISDVAVKVEREGKVGASSAATYRIHTRKGQTIVAKRILACPGAFLNHFPILPSPPLDITYRTAIVSRIRVKPGSVLDTLRRTMPSFTFASRRGRRENFGQSGKTDPVAAYEEKKDGGLAFYGLAPIRYPDGHYYLKVGYDSGSPQNCLRDPAEVTEWFRSGPKRNQAIGRKIAQLTKEFIKDLDISEFEVDTCVWLETPTMRPYIGRLDTNFYIVTGGNGFAAKSSDELGRLGAQLTVRDGKWPSGFLEEDMVRVRYKDGASKL